MTIVNYLCVCCTVELSGKLSESEKLNEILIQDCLVHLTWGIIHLNAKWDAKLPNWIYTQRNLFLVSALIGKHLSSTGFCEFLLSSLPVILLFLQRIHLFAFCMFCRPSDFLLYILFSFVSHPLAPLFELPKILNCILLLLLQIRISSR